VCERVRDGRVDLVLFDYIKRTQVRTCDTHDDARADREHIAFTWVRC